jgi:hypothetical protein
VFEGLAVRSRIAVAAVVLALKAVLGLWAAWALVTASTDNQRSFLGADIDGRQIGLGTLVLGLAFVTLVVIFNLMRFRRWARWAAIVLESFAVVLALTLVGRAAGPALVAVVLSLAVITLLASARLPDAD